MRAKAKSYPLFSGISKRIKRIHRNGVSGIKETINAKKTIGKVEKKLDAWIKDGKHHDTYESKDELLDELGLTGDELSFYCSSVLKKKFLTWRSELRIQEAKDLLIHEPDTPVCHIGYAVGFSDKSNFRQQFRKIVGCTPTEWRERNLSKSSMSTE